MRIGKELIQLHKAFLVQFNIAYVRKTYIKLLSHASDAELRVLLKVLHAISNGKIPLERKIFQELKRKKLVVFLNRHFRTFEDTQKLLGGSRSEQLHALYRLLPGLKLILSPLFVSKRR